MANHENDFRFYNVYTSQNDERDNLLIEIAGKDISDLIAEFADSHDEDVNVMDVVVAFLEVAISPKKTKKQLYDWRQFGMTEREEFKILDMIKFLTEHSETDSWNNNDEEKYGDILPSICGVIYIIERRWWILKNRGF